MAHPRLPDSGPLPLVRVGLPSRTSFRNLWDESLRRHNKSSKSLHLCLKILQFFPGGNKNPSKNQKLTLPAFNTRSKHCIFIFFFVAYFLRWPTDSSGMPVNGACLAILHPFMILHIDLSKAIKINYPLQRRPESKVNIYNLLINTVTGTEDSLHRSYSANLILHEKRRVTTGALQV